VKEVARREEVIEEFQKLHLTERKQQEQATWMKKERQKDQESQNQEEDQRNREGEHETRKEPRPEMMEWREPEKRVKIQYQKEKARGSEGWRPEL
jgi:hypothetical protein